MEEDNHSIGWGWGVGGGGVHFNRNESFSLEIIRLVSASSANVHCYVDRLLGSYRADAICDRQHMALVERGKWNRVGR